MHGEPSNADYFLYFLGERLGKSVTELTQLPARELANWTAYFKVKHTMEDLAARAASHG